MNEIRIGAIRAIRTLQSQKDYLISGEKPKTNTGNGNGSGNGSTTTPKTTTTKTTPADEVAKAEKEYADTISNAKVKLDESVIKQEEYDKTVLDGQKKLGDAYLKAYNATGDEKYLNAFGDTADKINEMQGVVDSNIEAQKKAEQSVRELERAQRKAAEAQNRMAEAQKNNDLKAYNQAQKQYDSAQADVVRIQTTAAPPQVQDAATKIVYTVEVNAEQLKKLKDSLPTDDETIKVNVEQGEISLPDMPAETYTVTIEAETTDAISTVDAAVTDMNAKKVVIPVEFKSKETFSLTQNNLQGFIASMKDEIANADLGQSVAQSLESMSDATAISNIMQTAIQNGIDTAQFDTNGLMQKLLNGEDISDDTIQAYVDQLNNLLKEKFDETEWPEVLIKFNVQSKEIENLSKSQQKDAQNMAKEWQAAGQAISAVGNAMNQIEDPAAKVLGTIAQAVATMMLSYSQAATQAASMGPWAWIAFAATGLATAITSVNAIKNATAGSYAEGGIIPGNSFSGDNLMANVNSGELILNKSQQNNLANALDGGGLGGLKLSTVVTAEEIRFILNNYGERTGVGEYLEA